MHARGKLNTAYFNGILILAGLFGLMLGSWPSFLTCFAILMCISLAKGEIRPTGRR